ncbi:unnamed protein product, partial [Musa acuminata var. zebrina]
VRVGHRFCTQAKKKANEPRQIPSPIQLPKAFSMQQGGDKDAVMRRRQGQGTGVAAGLLCNQTSHVLRAHCIGPLFCWLVEVIAPGACRPTVHTRLNLNHSSPAHPGPRNESPTPAT